MLFLGQIVMAILAGLGAGMLVAAAGGNVLLASGVCIAVGFLTFQQED